ncbi:kinase-like domain-containing protein, partial [Flagelloscypha sp. PMI_526]
MKLVAIRHRILPSSFFVTDIERKGENPIAGGGFADVYRGKWHGQEVCLKVLRVYLGAEGHNKDSAVSDFFKEAIVWQRLNHPNIMPFLGVDKTCFPGRLAFVSPFMENLDVMTFLRANPSHNRIDCLAQIASGLKYLHASSIVHGDIKGANVLVDSDCQCRLADFGISAVVELNGATLNASTGSIKGSLRWMPPEFIFPEADVKRSSRWDKFYNGDIYSFACTMIEII